jgi:hypothetical protein
MIRSVTTSNGKLQKRFLPAIYFDTSVIIDYWLTEGMELPPEAFNGRGDWAEISHGPVATVMRDLLKSDKRINKVVEIRKKAMFDDIKVTPVTSHVSLWELQEWNAEAGFKQLGAEISGAIFLQKKGKKEIGDYLKTTYMQWLEEGDEKHHDQKTGTSGLQLLSNATWINDSFAGAHGLRGIIVAETLNFCWPPKKSRNRRPFPNPEVFAYLQIGIADIFHILLAHHLGCQYFASFDSDFRRCQEFIEEVGMSLLSSPEEILSIF